MNEPKKENENCLAGVKCPRCGHTEMFKIEATTTLTLTDEGTIDDGRDHDYGMGSQCICGACGFAAPFLEFNKEGDSTQIAQLTKTSGTNFQEQADQAQLLQAVVDRTNELLQEEFPGKGYVARVLHDEIQIVKTEAVPASRRSGVLELYRELHDGLSDMVEEGRLTEGEIPDDYQWLADKLAEIVPLDPKNSTGPSALLSEFDEIAMGLNSIVDNAPEWPLEEVVYKAVDMTNEMSALREKLFGKE